MTNASINRTTAMFLQAVIVLVGIGVLAFLLGEPNVEGVNANATSLFDIYFDDPFLAYVYIGSIPFFVALYHAFTLLGNTAQNAVRRLRTIRNCAMLLVALILGAEAWIVMAMGGSDDIAGGVAMGLFAMVVSIVIGVGAAVLEKQATKKS